MFNWFNNEIFYAKNVKVSNFMDDEYVIIFEKNGERIMLRTNNKIYDTLTRGMTVNIKYKIGRLLSVKPVEFSEKEEE